MRFARPAIAVLTLTLLAANASIPERVRDASLYVFLSWNGCQAAEGGPTLTNAWFASGAGPLPTCSVDSLTSLAGQLRTAAAIVHVDAHPTGPEAIWGLGLSFEQSRAAEERFLGRALVPAAPSEENQWQAKWSGDGVVAAWEAWRVKPSDTVGGVKAQVLYDRYLKTAAASFVSTASTVLHTPGLVATVAEAMTATPGNYGRSTYEAVARVINEAKPKLGPVESDVLGTIVRRHMDGSWPGVEKVLRAALKEFDPAALKVLDDAKAGVTLAKVPVRVSPSEGRVSSWRIDGEDTYCDGPCALFLVTPGSHVFRAEADGGLLAEATIDVKAGMAPVVLAMKHAHWLVDLATDPPGAQVELDGRLLQTPQQRVLTVGEHVVRVVDPCRESSEKKLVLGQEKPGAVMLAAPPVLAVLHVEAVDSDGAKVAAKVTLDGGAEFAANEDAKVPACGRKLAVVGPAGKRVEKLVLLDPATPTRLKLQVAEPPKPAAGERAQTATWSTLGRQALGTQSRVAVECPRRSGLVNPVWGSGPFTDDSGVCTAALFRGRIDANGGRFFVKRVDGRSSYPSATRNGVSSFAYGPWAPAFEVE